MVVESTCNFDACRAIEPMQAVKKNFDLYLDLLTSESVQAKDLSWAIGLPSLVSIAPAVFLLERGQTNKQTDRQTNRQTQLNDLSHASSHIAGVG